jgi:protein-S-isoprenylcysteine O-methyltransferase Ste14
MRFVVAQFLLMAAIVGSWLVPPRVPDGALDVAGAALAAAGVALAFWAYRALGPAFTPFPEPRGERVTSGPYRYLRHPMYVGGIAFFAGLSLVFTVPGLVLTVVLAFLWWRKGKLEERLLASGH